MVDGQISAGCSFHNFSTRALISTYFVVSNLRVIGRDSIRSWLGLLRHDATGVGAYRKTLMPWFLTLTSSHTTWRATHKLGFELESVFDDL